MAYLRKQNPHWNFPSQYSIFTAKKMRIICVLLCLSLVLLSCEDDEKGNSAQFIFINEIAGKGSISLYDYPEGKLTEQYFTVTSTSPGLVYGALKSGNYMYMHTGEVSGLKLRKIDLTTGTQVKEVNTWSYSQAHIESYQGKIILSYAEYIPDIGKYLSFIKIYDENMVLQDSITEENVREMRAAKVANNRLFYNVIIEDVGSFIKVMDLSTKTINGSIEVPPCQQFVFMDETQLLVFVNTGYFILDTQLLESTVTKPPGIGSDPMFYSAKDKILYVLRSNAQPSLTQFTLGKIDLSSGQYTPLSKVGEQIAGPIIHDEKTNVIVTGGSGLKIFSTTGSLIKTVEVPYTTRYIFVN